MQFTYQARDTSGRIREGDLTANSADDAACANPPANPDATVAGRPPPTFAIVVWATPSYAATYASFIEANRAYAARHGYAFVLDRARERNLSWVRHLSLGRPPGAQRVSNHSTPSMNRPSVSIARAQTTARRATLPTRSSGRRPGASYR